MFSHPIRQHGRIFRRMKHYKCSSKACWERCLWLFDPILSSSNLNKISLPSSYLDIFYRKRKIYDLLLNKKRENMYSHIHKCNVSYATCKYNYINPCMKMLLSRNHRVIYSNPIFGSGILWRSVYSEIWIPVHGSVRVHSPNKRKIYSYKPMCDLWDT